ncbi:phosphopantetheine-binding protein [Methylocystis sp. JAN1]|uniref:phosphopantetheine-binding protein n=1 Tax=Methylocystis sp. JAN1 TaxID=3397211 RepID=UPI003FA23945
MFSAIQTIIDREVDLTIPATDLTPRADLYALGLTSFGAIRLLVAIERAFKVELPREMLKRETAASIAAIVTAIQAAKPAPAPTVGMRLAA